VRRLFDERGDDIRPHSSLINLLRYLEERELISRGLFNSIRDVYAICSSAIHGEGVSEAKVSFVRDVAPELIASLESIANQEMEHKS
jgi:hypothetical protein